MTPLAPLRLRAAAAACALGLTIAAPALAQYKVVSPDGSVTYTDRPPVDPASRVLPFAARTAPAAPEAALPLELRGVVSRFPVTLYVAPSGCEQCDAARTLLRGRGIPFDERSVTSAEDLDALEAATGARGVPAMRLGAQVLRGLTPATWHAYLDTAGYPRESRLPAGWRWSPMEPLAVPRVGAAPTPRAAPARPARPAQPPAPADPQPAEPGAIRF